MVNYQLAPYVRMQFRGYHLLVGTGSIQQIVIDKHLQRAILDAAEMLRNPMGLIELENNLIERGYSESLATKVLAILANRMLLPEGAFHPEDRYSSSLLYYSLSGADPDHIQRKISENHVAILGCGGIGSLIAANLVGAGIANLTLIDRDEVEQSHLPHEILFNETDCGQPKCVILAKYLREMRVSVNIQEIHDYMMRENLHQLDECNLIITTTKDPHPLTEMKRFAARRKLSYIEVGVHDDVAFWGPIVSPQSQLDNSEDDLRVSRDLVRQCRRINTHYQGAAFGPLVMLAASLASIDILKYLGDYGQLASAHKVGKMWTHNGYVSDFESNT